MGNSAIIALNGSIDGINKVFTTSTEYSPGTLRIIWNGQVYESDDGRKGWVEIDSLTIETNEAPRVDDVLQAFYTTPGGEIISNGAIGTPFDPNGFYP